MLGAEKLYTAAQTQALDQCAIDTHGISGMTLMSRAAAVVFRYLLENWPELDALQVLCGTGNNGGDGFLIADLAHKRGIDTTIIQVGDPDKMRGDALRARQQALANGVRVLPYSANVLTPAAVTVDAMLGTGLAGDVRGDFVAAIDRVNAIGASVLAVDIPSGLCADTGKVLGTAVQADLTVTFIGLKRGLFTLQAPDYIGALQFSDLEVPPAVYASIGASSSRLDLDLLLQRLAPRPASAHKGLYGTVLVVGGDYGMAGAAALAAEAALRCGAGLVRLATRPEHVAASVARTPEVMARGVDSADAIGELLEAADILIVGPGLGQSDWSEQLLHSALASGKPMVLDADALNLLARRAGGSANLPAHCVLTPHPGEAARLLDCTVACVQGDRFRAAAELQQAYHSVIVLKGNGTLVAAREQVFLSDYGNPGMASGGMGDVLSGVIGALLAQHLSPLEAAALGVCLHGAAADLAAADGQRGLLATDLMPALRSLLG